MGRDLDARPGLDRRTRSCITITALVANGQHRDRVRNVPQVIDPAQLVALQREVDRVELDSSLATYLSGAC